MRRIISYSIFEDLSDDQLEYLKDVIRKFPHKEGDIHMKKLSKMMSQMDKDLLEMKDILDESVDGKWKINEDGRIDVEGNFKYNGINYESKDLSFGKITGNFDVQYSSIKKLQGMPYEVGGNFNISGNKIGNLIGGPKKVGGVYDASSCALTSLEGCPKILTSLDLKYNELESLKYGPELVKENMDVSENKLKTLEYSPKKVGGDFIANQNQIESLKGCPEEIGKALSLRDNEIKSIEGITPKMGENDGTSGGTYRLTGNKIKNLIGLPESFEGSIWLADNPLESLEGITDNVYYISWKEGEKEFYTVGKSGLKGARERGSYLAYIIGENSEEVNDAIENDPSMIDTLHPIFLTNWYKPSDYAKAIYSAYKRGM